MPLGANKAAIMGVAGVETIGTEIALLSTQTETDATSISFTSDITSKYREYIFAIYNLNPATDDESLGFQGDASGGDDGYNDFNITSTFHNAYHNENDGGAAFAYETGHDQAQGTGFQNITNCGGNGADESSAAILHLFNPSSTVLIKNFYSRASVYYAGDKSIDVFAGGYFNTTSAINAIQFKMTSGNFDAKIKMWGVP